MLAADTKHKRCIQLILRVRSIKRNRRALGTQALLNTSILNLASSQTKRASTPRYPNQGSVDHLKSGGRKAGRMDGRPLRDCDKKRKMRVAFEIDRWYGETESFHLRFGRFSRKLGKFGAKSDQKRFPLSSSFSLLLAHLKWQEEKKGRERVKGDGQSEV